MQGSLPVVGGLNAQNCIYQRYYSKRVCTSRNCTQVASQASSSQGQLSQGLPGGTSVGNAMNQSIMNTDQNSLQQQPNLSVNDDYQSLAEQFGSQPKQNHLGGVSHTKPLPVPQCRASGPVQVQKDVFQAIGVDITDIISKCKHVEDVFAEWDGLSQKLQASHNNNARARTIQYIPVQQAAQLMVHLADLLQQQAQKTKSEFGDHNPQSSSRNQALKRQTAYCSAFVQYDLLPHICLGLKQHGAACLSADVLYQAINALHVMGCPWLAARSLLDALLQTYTQYQKELTSEQAASLVTALAPFAHQLTAAALPTAKQRPGQPTPAGVRITYMLISLEHILLRDSDSLHFNMIASSLYALQSFGCLYHPDSTRRPVGEPPGAVGLDQWVKVMAGKCSQANHITLAQVCMCLGVYVDLVDSQHSGLVKDATTKFWACVGDHVDNDNPLDSTWWLSQAVWGIGRLFNKHGGGEECGGVVVTQEQVEIVDLILKPKAQKTEQVHDIIKDALKATTLPTPQDPVIISVPYPITGILHVFHIVYFYRVCYAQGLDMNQQVVSHLNQQLMQALQLHQASTKPLNDFDVQLYISSAKMVGDMMSGRRQVDINNPEYWAPVELSSHKPKRQNYKIEQESDDKSWYFKDLEERYPVPQQQHPLNDNF